MSELRETDRRLEYVRERAATHRAVEQEVFGSYQRAGAQRTRGRRELAYTPIGDSTLPATVEVTEHAASLARQPEVLPSCPTRRSTSSSRRVNRGAQ
jgi:hypothetical protein